MVESLLNDAEQGVKLALAAGANDCIVSASDSCSTSVDYRDGKLEKVQQSAHRGLSLRLYVDGKYSSHNTCDLRPEQLKRFIEDAVALTHYLEPDPYRVIPDPALFANQPKDDLQLVDSEVLDLSRDQCLDWLKSMDAATHADKRVISSTSSVYHGRNMSAMASSNGFRGTRESTSAGYGSEVTLDEGNGKRPEAYRYVSKNHLSDLIPPERTAAECLERARARLGSTKLPTVRTMMVVDHEAAPHLLHYVMNALQAGALQQK
ncbi:MAG TPA: DNA gyrase modulator, partial [Planctomycetota bacterium]|nr:DNA gyrase modulator [Planctomycetota bacterium]